MSKYEDLERLGRLLDEGKIDQQEFDRLKAELLNEEAQVRDPRHSLSTRGPAKEAVPQAEEKKKKSAGSGCLVVILIVVVLAIYGSCTGNGSSDPADGGGQSSGHEAVEAYVVCQQFVEDRLKAPSTADFGGPFSRVTTHLGGGRYRVATYVDAQNSFGAMIRTNFVCEVSHISGDRYSLESLVMDE